MQLSIGASFVPEEEAYSAFGIIRPEKLVGLFPFDGPASNIAPLFDSSR